METVSELVQKQSISDDKWYVDGVWMSFDDLTREIITKWPSSKDIHSKRNCLWYNYGHNYSHLTQEEKEIKALLMFRKSKCLLPEEVMRAEQLWMKVIENAEVYQRMKEEREANKKSRKRGI